MTLKVRTSGGHRISPPEITASLLCSLDQCPKRVELDLFVDASLRDEISPFIAMLWRRGTLYEKEVMESGKLEAPDLSSAPAEDKERLTLEAMQRGEPLIYSGRIGADGLVGIADLLRRGVGAYTPINVKHLHANTQGGD